MLTKTIATVVGVGLAVLSSGCASYGTTVYVSDRFTADEELQIQAAADAWEAATDGSVRFDLAFGQRVGPSDDGKRTLIRASSEEEAQAWARAKIGLGFLSDPGVAGMTTHRESPTSASQTIAIVPTRFEGPTAHIDATMAQVVAHELGHAAGLQHLEDESAVMNIESPGAPRMLADHCLPEADYRQVRAVVGLGPKFQICK